ncbi:membrane protein [Streptomyces sp. 604F]|uniref:DUF6049 family protein n=1 Tax=Streptomyces TaxID=1883 RepID=UPI001397C4BC|nr:DUF6049 family protein [Streptomyces sp. 604F]MBP3078657.1 membrane protein [Streptomyces sp. 604F]QHV86266.1 hypothetical protein C3K23_16335 [Streptomyces sp. 604F]
MAEAADIPRTGPSAARRWLGRGAALLAGTALLGGLLNPVAAQAAGAPQAPAADAKARTAQPVSVSLDSFAPAAPVKGDRLTITGTVTNQSKRTITGAHVGLRVGPVLNGRSAIDHAARRDGFSPGADGLEIDEEYAQEIDSLAAGRSLPFRLSVPVEDLDLDGNGIYQLGVSLSGQTAAQPYEQVQGIERTFLPWQPKAAGGQTSLTMLWPLISTPHLTAETDSDEEQTPIFEDDSLAEEIAPGGRLERMVALGRELDITWVVDPDLLASVDAMRGGYRVRNEDGTTRAGSEQSEKLATDWLASVESAVAGKKIVALPYGDPDIASIAHRGKNVSGSLGRLKDATDVAASTVETILHVKPSTDFAWPVEGAVTPSVIDVATSAGARNVIARSDSMREPRSLTYTPSAARPIGGGTTAVVSDDRLSTLFQGDMTKAGNATLAVQRFVAQTLMTTLQDERNERSLVVAPQRMPTASQARTMAEALRALDDERWSTPQNLTAAAKTEPDARATTRVPGGGSYPSALRKQELPKAAFEEIKETQDKLDRFKVILTNQDRVVPPFGRAVDREMSTSWRGRAEEAQQFRSVVSKYLNQLIGSVQLIEKSEAKLSGHSATIPVTVQNNLLQGVDELVLRLESSKPTRLKIGEGRYQDQPVKVSGGHSQSVKFTTTANANGPVPVRAQLYTEDGRAYGAPIRFDVNVTEFTPTVMLVLAGGVLLLVLAGFRMYTQRKRQARELEAEQGGTPGEPGAGPAGEGQDGDGGPGQPGDPGPDTAPESPAPSGPGETVDR